MKWDIFSPGRQRTKKAILEGLDVVIRRIEAFAPRNHMSDRDKVILP